MRTSTLADGVARRDNCFGLLRLVLAALVIVSHCWPLGGAGPDPVGEWTGGQTNLGFLAVAAFFGISGFLITLSGLSCDPLQFVWQRVLRIMPAYWTVLIVGAVIVGPLGYAIQHGGLAGYWTLGPGGPAAYVVDNAALFVNQYGIHDVFAPTPWGEIAGGSVINGGIWTLYFEARCYLIVLLLMITGLFRRVPWLIPVGAVVTLATPALLEIAPGLLWVSHAVYGPNWGPRLVGVFLVGSSAALFKDRIPSRWWLGVAAGVITVGTMVLGGFNSLGYVTLTYFLLWLGTGAPRWAKRVVSRHDISYGVYLYGFPVQLLLSLLGWQRWGVGRFLLLSLAFALPLGVLSWLLVERPALRWKRRGPGVGLRVIRARVSAAAVSRPRSSSSGRRWPPPTLDMQPRRPTRDR